MYTGLFRQSIEENNFSHYITELSLAESDTIREKIILNFMKKTDVQCLWEGFKEVAKLIRDFEESDVLSLLKEQNTKDNDWLYVLSDDDRDKIIIKVQMKNIGTIIEEAWFPSEDLYICPMTIKWCIALTHHERLLLCKRHPD